MPVILKHCNCKSVRVIRAVFHLKLKHCQCIIEFACKICDSLSVYWELFLDREKQSKNHKQTNV